MFKHKILIATIACLLPVAATASVQSDLSSNINKAQQNFAATYKLQNNSTKLAGRLGLKKQAVYHHTSARQNKGTSNTKGSNRQNGPPYYVFPMGE